MHHLETDQLAEAVRSVWSTTLGLAVEPVGNTTEVEEGLVGSVGISGKWQGAITMQLPPGLARRAAAAMFMTDVEQTTTEELNDALGELVNQVAGLVRPMVSEDCVLSLPTVATGDHGGLAVLRTEVLLEVPLDCDGEPIVVTLLQKADA